MQGGPAARLPRLAVFPSNAAQPMVPAAAGVRTVAAKQCVPPGLWHFVLKLCARALMSSDCYVDCLMLPGHEGQPSSVRQERKHELLTVAVTGRVEK